MGLQTDLCVGLDLDFQVDVRKAIDLELF